MKKSSDGKNTKEKTAKPLATVSQAAGGSFAAGMTGNIQESFIGTASSIKGFTAQIWTH